MREGASTNNGSDTRDRGSHAIGIPIAGAIVGSLTLLPFVFLIALYVFLTIYAIVRAIGPGAGENAVTILVGFVLITTTLATLLGVAIQLVGRSLTPKRRRSKL